MDADQIQIEVTEQGTTCRVDVAGDLSGFTCSNLSAAVTGAIKGGATHVELDLGEVAFLDSSGIQCIVHARNTARDYGGRLRVVAMSDPARRVLEITGLAEPFTSGEPI